MQPTTLGFAQNRFLSWNPSRVPLLSELDPLPPPALPEPDAEKRSDSSDPDFVFRVDRSARPIDPMRAASEKGSECRYLRCPSAGWCSGRSPGLNTMPR